jgi:hypothetical protein
MAMRANKSTLVRQNLKEARLQLAEHYADRFVADDISDADVVLFGRIVRALRDEHGIAEGEQIGARTLGTWIATL